MNKKDTGKNFEGRKKFMISCKEATQLAVMGEFEKLSFGKRISLWFHMLICKVCRLFQQQSIDLNEAIKKNEEEKSLSLSLEKKEEISLLLNELRK